MATAAPKGKSFPFWRITKFATVYGSSVIQLPSALIEAVRSPFASVFILEQTEHFGTSGQFGIGAEASWVRSVCTLKLDALSDRREAHLGL